MTSAVLMGGTVCANGPHTGRVRRCASPPGTSTRSAPASTAWRPGWSAPTSTSSPCRRPRPRTSSSPTTGCAALGYEVAHHGVNQWNGVAILSRVGLDDVQVGFEGDPGWGEPLAAEARSIGATCGGIRMWSVYVPNGRAIGDPHMAYKLDWLARLREQASALGRRRHARSRCAATGTSRRRTTTCGRWSTTSTRATSRRRERAAFNAFLEAGFVDVVRPHTPGPGRLHLLGLPAARASPKRRGMRIDFVLGSPTLRRPRRRRGHRPRGAQGGGGERPRPGRRPARGLTSPMPVSAVRMPLA